jgi:hypothetical protein
MLKVEEGVEIQTNQLQKWEQLLKPEIYEWLEKRVTKDNHLAKNGYDIVRGIDISNLVENYLYYKERGEL